MGLIVLEGLAVIVAGMMAGNELCISLVNAGPAGRSDAV